MTRSRWYVAVAFVVSVAPLWAQDWIEYTDRADRFAVSLPAQPAVRSFTYTSWRGAQLPARAHELQQGSRRYAVTVVDFGMDKDVTDVLGSIAFAATTFRKRGGDITFDAYEQVDRIPGHELHITNPDKSVTYVAINLFERRLYILEATVPPGSVPPAEFQQSLSILDGSGEHVRFQLDENGNRVRRVPWGSGL